MPATTLERVQQREAKIKEAIAGLGEAPDVAKSRELGKQLRRIQRKRRALSVQAERVAKLAEKAAAAKAAPAPTEPAPAPAAEEAPAEVPAEAAPAEEAKAEEAPAEEAPAEAVAEEKPAEEKPAE